MMADQRRCKKGCRYYSSAGTCDYLLIVGKRRPSPPGEACTAFSKGDRRLGWDKELGRALWEKGLS